MGWGLGIEHAPNSGFNLFPEQRRMGENPHPVRAAQFSGPSSSIHKIATGGINRIPMSFILAADLPARFWPI